jgi:hypothetical protein
MVRDLTEDERRVLAEIKHEDHRDDELIDLGVDDSEVCIIEDEVDYDEFDTRGFELMEVEGSNYRANVDDQEQEEDEQLSQELYPSVADAFQTDDPEVIVPDPVESEGEWEEVVISDEDSNDSYDSQQNSELEDEEIPLPKPIPLKINPESLEQDILGGSPPDDEIRPHSSLQPQTDHWVSPQIQSISERDSLFEHLASQDQFEDFAVDDERYFEATHESMKYDQGALGTAGYDEGALDPETEALSAHFSGASRRT